MSIPIQPKRVPLVLGPGGELASVRARVWGAAIDSLLFAPLFIWQFVTSPRHVEQRAGANGVVRDVTVVDHRPALVALALAVPFSLYLIVTIGRWGRTLGERALHLHIVALDGSAPGWSRSVRRWAVLGVFTVVNAFVSFWPIGLLPIVIYGWMLIDKEQRQGLHDKAAGVIVVRDVASLPPPPAPPSPPLAPPPAS